MNLPIFAVCGRLALLAELHPFLVICVAAQKCAGFIGAEAGFFVAFRSVSGTHAFFLAGFFALRLAGGFDFPFRERAFLLLIAFLGDAFFFLSFFVAAAVVVLIALSFARLIPGLFAALTVF